MDTLARLQDALENARIAIAPPASGEDLRRAREWIAIALELAKQHKEEMRQRGINGAGSEGFGSL